MLGIDAKTLLTIFHVLGAVVGMGGALYADLLFMRAIKNRVISKDEFESLYVVSKAIWVGLTILVVSGILLFLLDPETYLHSTKFLTKMTIVGVIVINGAFFHYSHLPLFKRHQDTVYTNSKEFMKRVPMLAISGAVSIVSWVSSFVLGSLASLPFTYTQLMTFYVIIVFCAIMVTQLMSGKIFTGATSNLEDVN